jgi:hypothetical protein
MSEKLSSAQQADAFRIRVLIGHMEGRDDRLTEWMAEEIESGNFIYDPETETVFDPEAKLYTRILPNGYLKFGEMK